MASTTNTESPINYPCERGQPVGINSTYAQYQTMSTSPRSYIMSNQSYGRMRSPEYLALAPIAVSADYLTGRGNQTQGFSEKLDSRKKDNSDSGLGCGDKTLIRKLVKGHLFLLYNTSQT
ncbi:hypothetical protein Ciccas_013187 [Cichlidogyrus casuarinus]|uniref:Uncharacterized protein n=1 Tax=Cichlidogyrus casuarinus TaxID=1844966 RepID=A0ABD2PMP5_9PLAT